MKKAMIICGFPGVGKSCVANNRTNILDAESSAFSWIFDPETAEKPKRNHEFPANYIRYIKENMGRYDFILVSSHQNVRESLMAEGIQYIIVAPKMELKNEYLIRYLQRGNEIDFIELLNEKWDEFLGGIKNDGAPVIYLNKGEYMSDVLGAIAR
jgi:hypothetical protein